MVGLVVLFRFSKPVRVEIIPGDIEATSSALIWVDIGGAVAKPGVYQLNEGSRVKDALIAAGGLSEDADREAISRNVNLAAPVKDGAKLYFAATVAANQVQPGQEPASGLDSNLINLNTATTAQLESLDGIGQARAADIIAGRPYLEAEELVTKKILSEGVYQKIAEQVTVY